MALSKMIGLVLLISFLLLFTSCMDDPITSDLISDIEFLVGDTLLLDINSFTYRIPPAMGAMSSLYFGTDSTFQCPYTLLNMGFYSSGYEISFLSLDTSLVLGIDSLFLYLTYRDTVLPDQLYDYHITNIPVAEMDSVFDESASNYLNLDTAYIKSRMGFPIATTRLTSDTASYYPYLKFDLTSEADTILADFAKTTDGVTNRTFIVWRDNPTEGRQAFRSSEESSYQPYMDITFQYQASEESDIDTLDYTFYVGSDLSVVIPPAITDVDTTTISLGTALGVRSVLMLDYDSTFLAPEALIKSANLVLWKDTASEADSGFTVGIYSIDTTEYSDYHYFSSEEDPYTAQLELPDNFEADGTVELETRIMMQAVVLEQAGNYGMKLFSTTSNNPFKTYHFHSEKSPVTEKRPRLEVIYVLP